MVALFHSYGIGAVMAAIASLYIALALGLMLFGIETNLRPLEALAPERDLSARAPLADRLREPSIG
ncbi:MAG: hypothetical protein WDN49_01475 [Acetobacteraceae bacterium]